jgi:hypothetical protein
VGDDLGAGGERDLRRLQGDVAGAAGRVGADVGRDVVRVATMRLEITLPAATVICWSACRVMSAPFTATPSPLA